MNRFARATALGATLALMVAMVTGPQNAQAFDDAKEVKKAQQDILDQCFTIKSEACRE